jgi:hypothetical protein
MLKIFFPGGDILHTPKSLNSFAIHSNSQDDISVRLISRIFCLFSVEDAGINYRSINIKNKIDFDIS